MKKMEIIQMGIRDKTQFFNIPLLPSCMKRELGPVLEIQTQYSPSLCSQAGPNVTKTKKCKETHQLQDP